MYTTAEGTIARLDRRKASTNGNPRYRVTLVGQATIDTETDASVNYAIDNPEYRDVPVILTLERSKIVGIRTADGVHTDGPQG
jgi:hypothetical protein